MLFIPPPQNVGGGLYWIRFVASVGLSVSNSCPLYNSFTNGGQIFNKQILHIMSCPLHNFFTNGGISFKLEWRIHLN